MLAHIALVFIIPAFAKIRELSDDPQILLDNEFLTERQTKVLRHAANKMGYDWKNRHYEHTFLPVDMSYEPKKYELKFNPTYTDEVLDTVRLFEEKVANWTKIAYDPEEKPIMVSRMSNSVHKREDMHLDSHLDAYREKSVVAFLSTAESDKLVFPCVETFAMEPREWRERREICERSFRHLRAAHEKLQRDLDKGFDLATGHYEYLMENTHLSVFAEVFTLREDTGMRNWSWMWGDDEEQNLLLHHHVPGLVHVLNATCAGEEKALIVPATLGTAVQFPVARGEGRPEWHTWHALCGKSAMVAEKGKDTPWAQRKNWTATKKHLQRKQEAERVALGLECREEDVDLDTGKCVVTPSSA